MRACVRACMHACVTVCMCVCGMVGVQYNIIRSKVLWQSSAALIKKIEMLFASKKLQQTTCMFNKFVDIHFGEHLKTVELFSP